MELNATLRQIEEAEVVSQQEIGRGYWRLTLRAPGIARSARPGQFVHLRLPGLDPAYLLRRPFSLHKVAGETIAILYKVIGVGTKAMVRLEPKSRLNVMGPLGNGFPPVPSGVTPLLIGGGYGSAPLFFLAERSGTRGIVFLGGRSQEDLLGGSDFETLGWEVQTATEDGTAGKRGLVTDLLTEWLEAHPGDPTEWYACGPDGMLKAVALLAERKGVRAWLSLDRRMGCGAGVCLACVVRVRRSPAEGGGWKWARVCQDGPVFESREVIWEEETP